MERANAKLTWLSSQKKLGNFSAKKNNYLVLVARFIVYVFVTLHFEF
jgi:hypothetical protein